MVNRRRRQGRTWAVARAWEAAKGWDAAQAWAAVGAWAADAGWDEGEEAWAVVVDEGDKDEVAAATSRHSQVGGLMR